MQGGSDRCEVTRRRCKLQASFLCDAFLHLFFKLSLRHIEARRGTKSTEAYFMHEAATAAGCMGMSHPRSAMPAKRPWRSMRLLTFAIWMSPLSKHALPLCRAVVASDCTQISEFNSQCDPALLNSFPLQTPTLSSQEGRFKQCTTGTTCLRKPCQHDSTCRRRHSLWNELSSLSLSFRFPIVDSVDPPAAITAEDCR